MDTSKLKIALLTAMIATGAGAVSAQERGGPEMSFETLDVDGSGEITSEDFDALRENRFGELDANSDGLVSKDEFVAAMSARAADRASDAFDRLDADGDGSLSRDAVEASRRASNGARMIRRFDADNSGGISEAEFDEAKARMAERGRGGKRGDGRRGGNNR